MMLQRPGFLGPPASAQLGKLSERQLHLGYSPVISVTGFLDGFKKVEMYPLVVWEGRRSKSPMPVPHKVSRGGCFLASSSPSWLPAILGILWLVAASITTWWLPSVHLCLHFPLSVRPLVIGLVPTHPKQAWPHCNLRTCAKTLFLNNGPFTGT